VLVAGGAAHESISKHAAASRAGAWFIPRASFYNTEYWTRGELYLRAGVGPFGCTSAGEALDGTMLAQEPHELGLTSGAAQVCCLRKAEALSSFRLAIILIRP